MNSEKIQIDYKMPNVPQALRMMSKLGITEKGLENTSMFAFVADFMELIEPYIESVTIDGEESTWQAALEHPETIQIASALMERIFNAYQGQDSESKKP